MKLMEALKERRAVRSFLPDPVSREVLQELIDAATLAPSYMNLQPWSFGICADSAVVAGFDQQAKQHLLDTLVADSSRGAERDELAQPEFKLFYDAPALIVVYATRPDIDADLGCAMAAYNLMLAAHTMGLGSCWVSQARPWLASAAGHAAMGVPRDWRVVAPIVVGAPVAAPLSPGRFKPRTHWLP